MAARKREVRINSVPTVEIERPRDEEDQDRQQTRKGLSREIARSMAKDDQKLSRQSSMEAQTGSYLASSVPSDSQMATESPGTMNRNDFVRMWVESQCGCGSLQRHWHSMSHMACLQRAASLSHRISATFAPRPSPKLPQAARSGYDVRGVSDDLISWADSLDSLSEEPRGAAKEAPFCLHPLPSPPATSEDSLEVHGRRFWFQH